MNNFFNVDNAFFGFMGKFWDLVYLNILWVICCIPIVTIGPATTALYYSVIKVVRRQRGYVTREFFHSFKDNLKTGILSTLVFLVLSYVLWIDYNYAILERSTGSLKGDFLVAGFIAVTIMAVFVLVFIYPILSRFTLNLRGLFKTTFIISMKHFPTTFMMAMLFLVCCLGVYLFFPFVFLVPSICCFFNSFLIERIFKKYMPKPEETPDDNGKDLWYWE